MITWLSEKEFEQKFETDYRLRKIYLSESLAADISYTKVSQLLSASLDYSVDPNDGLGSHHVWYGEIDDQLFTLTCLLDDQTHLSFRPKRENEKYQWSFLEKLAELHNRILRRITWIRNDFSVNYDFQDEARSSVFYRNEYGIVVEVYRAANEIETQELLRFLQSLNPELGYWMGPAEKSDQIWITIKKAPDKTEKIFGRYNQRSTAEDLARRLLLRDQTFYSAREQKTGQPGLTFLKGMIFSKDK